MAKINFTKAENAFDQALRKLFIDKLSELAAIATVIQDPQGAIASKGIEEIITRFQKELSKLKKQDRKLYKKLNLTAEDEARLAIPSNEFLQEDWLRLKALKIRIDELKGELYGQEQIEEENEKHISKERHRHINKRHNIRDGWLPLH